MSTAVRLFRHGSKQRRWARWLVGGAGLCLALPILAAGPAVANASSLSGLGTTARVHRRTSEAGRSSSSTGKPEMVVKALPRGHFSMVGVDGTSCVSATWCVAVGSASILHGSTQLPIDKALIWRFGGRSWRITNRLGIKQSSLVSVSCVSRSFCMAVGRAGNPTGAVLALAWNGRAWSRVSAASPASSGNGDALGSVDCLSPKDCWAIGGMNLGESSAGLPHDLVEHWNGHRFSEVAAPKTGTLLSAISCAGAHDCWVSVYPSGSRRSSKVVEHFNGHSWRTVRLPESLNGGASGISCRSIGACWLVGGRNSGGLRPVSLRLVDGAWRKVAMQSPQYPDVTLQGLDCASSSDCWAVGDNYIVGPGVQQPSKSKVLAEHWDGTAWSIATVLGTKTALTGNLVTAACSPTGLCIAGGQASDGQPLVAISKTAS